MSSRSVNCHDVYAQVNGDTNVNQDAMNSSSNRFLPAGFIQYFPSDNSGSTVNRDPDDNPVWQEVAKRYQQILEKEYKLLSTCPLYRDGQIILHSRPVSLAVNTSSIPIGDTNFKYQSHNRDEEECAPTCKSTQEQKNAFDVNIKEQSYKSVTKEMKDKTFPKILEVYSLNSPKTQPKGETGNQKRKYSQDVSPSIKEEDGNRDGDPPTRCSFKKLCVDNFIDLTVDEEEETIACSSDDIKVNENYRSDLKQLEEGTNDKGMECESTKGKRKGVFSLTKKGEMNQPIQQKKRDTSKNPTAAGNDMSATNTTNKNHCNSDGTQHKHHNGNGHEENKYIGECTDTLHDQNNNKNITKQHEERKQNGMCDNLNNSDSYLLNKSHRENKITDLKAKLAKQEEELTKLKTLKAWKTVPEDIPQTPFIQLVEKSERKENSRLELDDQKQEEHTPGTVTLDDICQHVIKSFDIFNARQDKKMGKEGFNSRQVFKENNSIMSQATVKDGNEKQDEFLFHFGLRRQSLN